MSTDRIRLTITVTPEVHEVFSRMAVAQGVSLGRAMGDWLADTSEGAQFVAHKMEEARKAPRVVMREMHAFAKGLVDEVESTIEEMRRPAGRPDARSAAARPVAGQHSAPSSNTGLKSPRGGVGGTRKAVRKGGRA